MIEYIDEKYHATYCIKIVTDICKIKSYFKNSKKKKNYL